MVDTAIPTPNEQLGAPSASMVIAAYGADIQAVLNHGTSPNLSMREKASGEFSNMYKRVEPAVRESSVWPIDATGTDDAISFRRIVEAAAMALYRAQRTFLEIPDSLVRDVLHSLAQKPSTQFSTTTPEIHIPEPVTPPTVPSAQPAITTPSPLTAQQGLEKLFERFKAEANPNDTLHTADALRLLLTAPAFMHHASPSNRDSVLLRHPSGSGLKRAAQHAIRHSLPNRIDPNHDRAISALAHAMFWNQVDADQAEQVAAAVWGKLHSDGTLAQLFPELRSAM